jgi:NSS family neurotransmitter:Na+ symporter
MTSGPQRETFGSRIGALLAMIGVAAGLGNIWRFPYMVGEFGGAAFVLFYLAAVVLVGVPGLMAEWTLGRLTRRGPVGAFERGGLRLGRQVGWFFFVIMIAGLAYYTAVLGWVLFHGLAYLVRGVGMRLDPALVLPPETGLEPGTLLLEAACTGLVIAGCALMLSKGVRRGIEAASRMIIPGPKACPGTSSSSAHVT